MLLSCSYKASPTKYTPLYSENKITHTFMVGDDGIIWVIEPKTDAFVMHPNMTAEFVSYESPGKTTAITYNIIEPRGYNWEGIFCVKIPMTSELISLLKTHTLRSITVETLKGKRVYQLRHGPDIIWDINKLKLPS